MYDVALEASYDRALNTRWDASAALLMRLLAAAGPDALEGDGRRALVARLYPLLRPVAADTMTLSRALAARQTRAMGLNAALPDLAELALTEMDVHDLLAAAARYFFATGNKKDYTDPVVKSDAFSYAVQLAGRSAITALSDKRLTASTATYAAAGIQVFERYLGSGDACDRCKEIAGARVTRDDVKPLHDRCTCGVRPVAR